MPPHRLRAWIGVLAPRPDGSAPPRIGCDTLDQVKQIYEAGKDNIFLIKPKVDELAKTLDALGEPVCVIVHLARPGRVIESVKLGPIINPIGDAKLAYWAVHMRAISGPGEVWVMLLDLDEISSSAPADPMVAPMGWPMLLPFGGMAI